MSSPMRSRAEELCIPTSSMCSLLSKKFHRRCKGGYAVIAMIAGVGMVAFRDLHGIRPLVFGKRGEGKETEFMIASESVALQVSGFDLDHDLAPGEVLFIDLEGTVYKHQSRQAHEKAPCLFEFVYLARPDSVLDGASRIPMPYQYGDQAC